VRLRALGILHPFPSALNAVLVAAIVVIAGGDIPTATRLAVAMLLIQFCIGVTNDVFDQADDQGRMDKPLVRGDIGRRTATLMASVLGAMGLALAASVGWLEAALLAVMLSAGLAYDAALKRLGLGWLAYAVAFPLLPAYAWLGATGQWPPRSEVLLPIAVLAGPALALSNALVDVGRDRAAGTRTVVVRLGRARSLAAMGALLVPIHSVAWWTAVAAGAPIGALATMAVASLTACAGAWLSATRDAARRERGWRLQTLAIALLAAGWFLGVVVPAR
jgi:1,4-dihydroxy-2-naphthoate polyprenyltransferase